jgi:hypothetical protein
MRASIAALPPLVCSASLGAQGGRHVPWSTWRRHMPCSTWRHLPYCTLALQHRATTHTCRATRQESTVYAAITLWRKIIKNAEFRV